jgi:hypothetical protein
MRSRLAVVMLTLVASLCLAASPQKPSKTKYLLTTVAGFMMTEESGAAYSMAYEVREKLPAQVFVGFRNSCRCKEHKSGIAGHSQDTQRRSLQGQLIALSGPWSHEAACPA